MGIIVDGIILLCLATCIFMGYKRGFSASIFKIMSFILAVALSLILYKPVSNIVIEKTHINENIKNSIVEKFDNEAETVEDQEAKGNSMDKSIFSNISEKIKNTTNETKEKVIEESSTELSNKIVHIGIGIALFLVIRIILLIVAFVLSLITKLPVIEQFDKVGGIIYGILQGLIIVYIVLAIISFANVLEVMQPVESAIRSSLLGNMLYSNNIIINFFIK